MLDNIALELTRYCDKACKHCGTYANLSREYDNSSMSLDAVIKILDQIVTLLEDYTDSYSDDHEERGILPVSFTYLVFVPYTELMRKGEWLNREEYEERIAESLAKIPKEDILECQKDHDTFFRYGLACPVCGEKPKNYKR